MKKKGCVLMDENKENQNNDTREEIKKEASETFSEVKKSIKETNLKKDAKETKNFLVNFFKSPFTELKKVTTNSKSFLKIAIILLVVWIIAELIGSIIMIVQSSAYSYYSNIGMYFRNSMEDFFQVIGAILVPILSIALLSFILYALCKKQKRNFLTIITTVMIAKIPLVLASILHLLTFVGGGIATIVSAVCALCNAISMVLIYFAIKNLFVEEDDNKVMRTFLIAMSIYYGISIILNFLHIYLY